MQADVVSNVARVKANIERAARDAGRDPSDVTIVAAAKSTPPGTVRWACESGIGAVGHNYAQELRDAHAALADVDVRWHFIGNLRSGTANLVADTADVVETVAGERAVRRLAGRAARRGATLAALVEVDLTGRRHGVAPGDAAAFCAFVEGLEGLRVTGLMTVPPADAVGEAAAPWFRRLRDLRDQIREKHPQVLDLSMGMSLDYEVAVREGATMVRIGTALFGPRTP